MDSGASRCRFTNTLAFARCQALHPALPEASAPVALGAPGQAEQGQRRRKRQPMSPSPLHPLQKPEAPSGFGRTLRVSLGDADQRIFTPTPQGSPSWRRGYVRRSALERVNSRIDNGFRFERHSIRGKDRMTARVGLTLVVMMAMALGNVRAKAHPKNRPKRQCAPPGTKSRLEKPETHRAHPPKGAKKPTA